MTAESGLIRDNISLLGQALQVLAKLSDASYTHEVSAAMSSAAKHFRHIFNHYDALLGARGDKIDYETRERGTEIETSRAAAERKAHELTAALPGLTMKFSEGAVLQIERVIHSADGRLQALNYSSSLARELDFVHQHTVHHFAMIALILQHQGVDVPAEFGMSPSTLRFNAALAAT